MEFNEWDVVLAISVLLGIAAILIPPIVKATKAVTTLTTELKFIGAQMKELKEDNTLFRREASEKHGKIHERIDDAEEKLNDHEKRIYTLEHK